MEGISAIDGTNLGNSVPLSGNALIDAILWPVWNDKSEEMPCKNWNSVGTEQGNILYYTFAQDAATVEKYIAPTDGTGVIALTKAQQAGYVTSLGVISDVTGITFAYTTDAAKANLYFYSSTELPDGNGVTLGWTEFSKTYDDKTGVVINDAGIVSDNTTTGFHTPAFVTVLHELGHAMGLKHPFDAFDTTTPQNLATLPSFMDNEAITLMSYTNPQETTEKWYTEGENYFSPLDLLALNYLYGTDGLNGSEGITYMELV